jgi:aminoglycoside phosphotransferase (APT) family kinase protein
VSALADACAMVPGILAAAPQAARGCLIDDAVATSTDMAVLRLAPPSGPATAVLKLPLTPAAARGLARETRALAEIHGDPRLGEWRALLPRPLAAGTARGRPYRIDSVLRGRAPTATTVELQAGAAAAIHALHAATASAVRGEAMAGRWIDAPLRELERHGAPDARVRHLRDELHRALAGRRLTAGWIHGDYWLGNVLLDGRAARPAGIVDWEAAAAPEPPLHDVLHLVVWGRRMTTGEQLGPIVRRQLAGGGWTPHERALLDRYAAWCGDGALTERHAVLLYWLRQVALHARQQSRIGGARHRLWERRNVHPVLAAL